MYTDTIMEPTYKEVFEERIASAARGVSVISYDSRTGTSGKIYHPFSHAIQSDGAKALGELLRNYLVFYAYDESEIVTKYQRGHLDDLEKAAMLALKHRIPRRNGDTNGLYSEALLHLILEFMYDDIKRANLRTVYRQPTDNSEIKGFDSAHMIIDETQKRLYLGQAKLGGKEYCIAGIRDDMKKLNFLYTYGQLVFIADKTGYISTEVKVELEKINNLLEDLEFKDEGARKEGLSAFFNENNYKLVIPCMLAYEGPQSMYANIQVKIYDEVQNIISRLDNSTLDIDFCNYELMFIVFPMADIREFRDGMGLENV